jgi:hypothetical protein
VLRGTLTVMTPNYPACVARLPAGVRAELQVRSGGDWSRVTCSTDGVIQVYNTSAAAQEAATASHIRVLGRSSSKDVVTRETTGSTRVDPGSTRVTTSLDYESDLPMDDLLPEESGVPHQLGIEPLSARLLARLHEEPL